MLIEKSRYIFCTGISLFQQYISSAKMISSTLALQLFTNPTQAIWSRAFSSSVTPAAPTIRGSSLSIHSWAVSSMSSRWAVSFPLPASSRYRPCLCCFKRVRPRLPYLPTVLTGSGSSAIRLAHDIELRLSAEILIDQALDCS